MNARALGLVAALVLLVQILGFHTLRHDDAYITYRYGQNLASGRGLVFNPNERILSGTSPAHSLIAAVVYRLVGRERTPSAMSAIGCVGWTAQALAIWVLLRGPLGTGAATAIALVVALGGARSGQWVALETHLAAALTLWTIVLGARGSAAAAGVLCGLAALARPDTLLAAAPVGLGLMSRHGLRPALRYVSIAIAVVSPWALFATWYFGSPTPRSAIVQFHRSDVVPYLLHAASHVATTFLPVGRPVSAIVVAAALVAIGVALAIRRRDFGLSCYAAYGALHLGAYLYLRPVIGHDWHLYPLALAVVVLGAIGLWAVSLTLSPGPRRVLQSIFCVLLPLAFGARFAADALAHRTAFWFGARDSTYREVASFLTERSRPGDRFASPEVGTIAYWTDLRAFDLVGLVTPSDRPPAGGIQWLVLDPTFLGYAPPLRPVATFGGDGFPALVFALPEGSSYFDYFRSVGSRRR